MTNILSAEVYVCHCASGVARDWRGKRRRACQRVNTVKVDYICTSADQALRNRKGTYRAISVPRSHRNRPRAWVYVRAHGHRNIVAHITRGPTGVVCEAHRGVLVGVVSTEDCWPGQLQAQADQLQPYQYICNFLEDCSLAIQGKPPQSASVDCQSDP